jgi:cyclophilin family peptidyl-prolyl cis-trans isomerase
MSLFSKRRPRPTSPVSAKAAQALLENPIETLEQRLAFYQNSMIVALPTTTIMDDWHHTVVRIDTNVGKIDIELFDDVAPLAVTNFKNYIKKGRYDETFFHRLASGFVLQGGGFRYDDATGESSIPVDAPINNEFNRSNLLGTIAMAKLPGNPNSATSQFFFNLANNSGSLDTTNGGYTVFGRVIQGWSVIQTIAGYAVRDLDQAFTGSNPNPGTFDTVPTTPAYNPGVGPREATLVKILDIEMIKERNSTKFFEQSYAYPEGFRSATVTERVDLVNLDSSFSTYYQIIVRYENGDRDQVVDSGSLLPSARRSVKLTDAANQLTAKVRAGVGYAIIVRSSRSMGVSLDHRDNGVTLQENFVMEGRQQGAWMQRWAFGGGERGATFKNYILVANLSDQTITVNFAIYPENGTQILYMSRTVEGLRRYGISIHDLGALVPAGNFSVQVVSTGPVVAGFSQYNTGGNPVASDADSAQAMMNGGSTEGYLAGAYIASTNPDDAKVDLLFWGTSPSAIVVDFTFYLSTGGVMASSPVLLTVASVASRRETWKLRDLNAALPLDTFFAVKYQVRNNAAPVAVSYRTKVAGDTASTPFQTQASSTMVFADGYTDPNAVNDQETISIFNPYTRLNVTFFYELRFHFSDGTYVTVPAGLNSIAPLHRIDVRATQFPTVMTKINAAVTNRFYSVEIVTSAFGTNPVPLGGVVAQVTRWHPGWGMSMTSIAAPDVRVNLQWLSSSDFD